MLAFGENRTESEHTLRCVRIFKVTSLFVIYLHTYGVAIKVYDAVECVKSILHITIDVRCAIISGLFSPCLTIGFKCNKPIRFNRTGVMWSIFPCRPIVYVIFMLLFLVIGPGPLSSIMSYTGLAGYIKHDNATMMIAWFMHPNTKWFFFSAQSFSRSIEFFCGKTHGLLIFVFRVSSQRLFRSKIQYLNKKKT